VVFVAIVALAVVAIVAGAAVGYFVVLGEWP